MRHDPSVVSIPCGPDRDPDRAGRGVTMDIGDPIGDITLETAAGDRTTLSDHLDSILVVQLLRYYG